MTFFEPNKELIDGIIRSISNRRGLNQQDRNDFRSDIYLLFAEKGEHILSRFQSKNNAQLKTYLSTVINNAYLEKIRRDVKPRWRPSTKAQRMGIPAELFEEQRYRYQRSLDETLEVLRVNHLILVIFILARQAVAELKQTIPASPWQILKKKACDIYAYRQPDFNDLLLGSLGRTLYETHQNTIRNKTGISLDRSLLEQWDIELEKRAKSVGIVNLDDPDKLSAGFKSDLPPMTVSFCAETKGLKGFEILESVIQTLSAEDRMMILLYFGTSFQITKETLLLVKPEIESPDTKKCLESLGGIRCATCDELENVLDSHLQGKLPKKARILLLQNAEQLRGLSISEIARRLGKKRSEVDKRLKEIIANFRVSMTEAGISFEGMNGRF